MMKLKSNGFSSILLISLVGLAVIVLLIYFGMDFFKNSSFAPAQLSQNNYPKASPSPRVLSNDPAYKEIKDRYHMTEEQLQVIATVHQGDNK